MQVLQRIVLIILAIGVLLLPGYMEYQQKLFFIRTWESAEEERFFENICRKGYVTAEDYEAYIEKMLILGSKEVRIQEYREVLCPDGEVVYELITWDEIKEELIRGSYVFQTGSEVRLYTTEKIYYGLAGRK